MPIQLAYKNAAVRSGCVLCGCGFKPDIGLWPFIGGDKKYIVCEECAAKRSGLSVTAYYAALNKENAEWHEKQYPREMALDAAVDELCDELRVRLDVERDRIELAIIDRLRGCTGAPEIYAEADRLKQSIKRALVAIATEPDHEAPWRRRAA
jgi:hypothetical protein